MTTWRSYCNNISLGVGIGIGIIYCYLMLRALLSSIELLFGLYTSSFYIKIMKHLEQEAVATLLQSLHGAGVAAKAIQILAIWSNDIHDLTDLTDLTSMYLYATACCRKTAHWMLNTSQYHYWDYDCRPGQWPRGQWLLVIFLHALNSLASLWRTAENPDVANLIYKRSALKCFEYLWEY